MKANTRKMILRKRLKEKREFEKRHQERLLRKEREKSLTVYNRNKFNSTQRHSLQPSQVSNTDQSGSMVQ